MTSSPLAAPPASIFEGGRPNLGRFAGPLPVVELERTGLSHLRLKEWHYTSITTEQHFVAFAMVQLGYVANVFAYVVDRRRPARARMMETLVPFGRGLDFAPSSVAGTTHYRRGRDRIAVTHRESGFSVRIDLAVDGTRLDGAFDCVEGASASLVHRLPSGGLAYTHKGTLYRTVGTLRYGDESLLTGEAHATLDWTRSQAERTTTWKWASFAGRDTAGRLVGLNLSAEVYDDPNGDSQENFLYTEAGAIPLGGVRFELPRAPLHMPWRIASRVGDEVDLAFEPLGARSQNVNLGLLESRFVQPYGLYHGRVHDREVRGTFGVAEDHRSVW